MRLLSFNRSISALSRCVLAVGSAVPNLLGGPAAQRLLLFVLRVGGIAGLTFDAVYGELRTQDVADTIALTRPEPTHASRQRQEPSASRTISPVVTRSSPFRHPVAHRWLIRRRDQTG